MYDFFFCLFFCFVFYQFQNHIRYKKRERKLEPCHTGFWNVQFTETSMHYRFSFFFFNHGFLFIIIFFIPFFAWISNKMSNIQNVLQYLQQFYCLVLISWSYFPLPVPTQNSPPPATVLAILSVLFVLLILWFFFFLFFFKLQQSNFIFLEG